MVYLVDCNQTGKFWVFNSSESTFTLCEEIFISDEYSIIIFVGQKDINMLEKYEMGSMEVSSWFGVSRRKMDFIDLD